MGKLLKRLRENYPDMFKSVIKEPLTLQERLLHLNINTAQEHKMRELAFKEMDLNDICKDSAGPTGPDTIDLDLLVGTCRSTQAIDWIEYLGSLHKMTNFEHPPETYQNILSSSPDNDLPSVIYYNGHYYIDGGGNHRLTIGKCMGITRAKVYIQSYKDKP